MENYWPATFTREIGEKVRILLNGERVDATIISAPEKNSFALDTYMCRLKSGEEIKRVFYLIFDAQ